MTSQQLYERIEVALEIRITWPGRPTILGVSRYISDDETLLVAEFAEKPPVGTEMLLQLNAPVLGQEAPIIPAVVIGAEGHEITYRLLVQNGDC